VGEPKRANKNYGGLTMKLSIDTIDEALLKIKNEGKFTPTADFNTENRKEIQEIFWKHGIENFKTGSTIYNLKFYPNASLGDLTRIE
jgi:hypothetical protein